MSTSTCFGYHRCGRRLIPLFIFFHHAVYTACMQGRDLLLYTLFPPALARRKQSRLTTNLFIISARDISPFSYIVNLLTALRLSELSCCKYRTLNHWHGLIILRIKKNNYQWRVLHIHCDSFFKCTRIQSLIFGSLLNKHFKHL